MYIGHGPCLKGDCKGAGFLDLRSGSLNSKETSLPLLPFSRSFSRRCFTKREDKPRREKTQGPGNKRSSPEEKQREMWDSRPRGRSEEQEDGRVQEKTDNWW